MQLAGRVALSSLAGVIVAAGTSVFSGIALALGSGILGWSAGGARVLMVAPQAIAVVAGLAAAVWTHRQLKDGPRPSGNVGGMFIARMTGGMAAGTFAGYVLVGAYLAARGEDTGAALGAMLIGAPVGATLGLALGAISGFLALKKKRAS
jgi:hypothetical protein